METAAGTAVKFVGKHRKERCRDTVLRDVGSLTEKWHNKDLHLIDFH
jgi:hypothetical protein